MSCSARLPVYTLLVAAFVPAVAVAGVFSLQGLTMLGMYLLGTVAALAAAAVFRRTLLRSETRALIIELPPYSLPSGRVLANSVWQRVRLFLRRAGTVIFAISILLWGMATYPRATAAPGQTITQEQRLSQSALGRLGHAIEPAVRPLGYDWKIGVSMMASFAAREVFVSTMGTIYGVSRDGTDAHTLAQRLREERNPATGRAGLHAAHRRRADGVLRVRPDVHQHRDHDPPRNGRRVARGWLGAIAVYIYAGTGLRRRLRHLSRRIGPRPGRRLMNSAWIQPALVALALTAAAAYLLRRAWTRWLRARQPQSGACGPNCGCGDDSGY